MDAHLALELHYEDTESGQKGNMGPLPLIYVLRRMAMRLHPLLSEGPHSLDLGALETVMLESLLTPFSPQAKPAPKDMEMLGLEALAPLSPGRVIRLTPDGDVAQERFLTDNESEALRYGLNRALQAVADDPARFDHPLLLGERVAPLDAPASTPPDTSRKKTNRKGKE